MFDWIGSIFKGVVSVLIVALSSIGIGGGSTITYETPTTTPTVETVETEATTTLSEIDELKLALEEEKAARLKLEGKISSGQNKSTNVAPAVTPPDTKKAEIFTTPSGVVVDEA